MITTIENQALVFSVKNNNKINKLCTPLHGEILTSLYGPSFFVSQGNEVDVLFKGLFIISLVSPFTLKGNKFLETMWKTFSSFKSVVIGDDHAGCQKLRR